MPKASRRPKLTKEELKAENARLKAEINSTSNAGNSQRIMDVISKENWIAYLLTVFVPPLGIWYIWAKKEKHKLTFPAMCTWTLVGCVITYRWLTLAAQWWF